MISTLGQQLTGAGSYVLLFIAAYIPTLAAITNTIAKTPIASFFFIIYASSYL